MTASAEAPPAERRSETRFALGGTAAFALWVMVGITSHEMWRDEFHAWFLALESPSIPALLDRMAYEGHPPLWHALLWCVTRVTTDPVAMQVLQGVVITGAAFVMLRYAPFPRYQRLLAVFGYFLAYEYAVFARPYGLGVLLVVACCAYLSRSRISVVVCALLLTLLANVSVYGAILALALGAAFLVEMRARAPVPEARTAAGQDGTVAATASRPGWGRFALGAGLLGAGFLVAVYMMRPPADASFLGRPQLANAGSFQWELFNNFLLALKAYVPIPRSPEGMLRWRSSIFVARSALPLALFGGAGLFLMVVFAASLTRRPAALATFVVGTSGMLLFAAVWHTGSLRHFGHLFLVLLAAMWLGRTTTRLRAPPPILARISGIAGVVGRPLFVVVLLGQVGAAVLMGWTELRHDFSGGEAVARYVDTTGGDALPVAVLGYPQSVAGYLGDPVFQTHTGEWGRTAGLGARFVPGRALENRMERLEALVRERGEVLLVSNEQLEEPPPSMRFAEVFRTGPTMVPSESFVVYRVWSSPTVR